MPKLNINNGGVDTNKKMPDIDERFGPYTSTEAANAALGGQGRNTITAGLTVGIQTANAGVKEYWYQPNKKTGQLELIPKGGNAADNPTEGNFASFDENGNVVDSGNKDADFAPIEQAVPMGDTEDVGKILEKQANGFGWVEKPVDGDDAYHVWLKANGYDEKDHPVSEYNEYNRGKSAREIYNATYNKNLNDAEFAAELKMNYPMLHVGYNASNAGETVGIPFTGNLDPSGENIGASESTMGKLYLMSDAASDPENCIGFVTVLDGQTYKWCNVGAIRIPSDALAKSDVDNECVDGATDEPASANVVMGLKAKLEGVTASKVKVQPIIDWYPDGSSSGFYKTDKTWNTSNSYCSTRIDVHSCKKVVFLGVATVNTTLCALLTDSAGTIIDSSIKAYKDESVVGNEFMEYSYEIADYENAYYLVCPRKNGSGTLETNFYCFLCSGDTVLDYIAATNLNINNFKDTLQQPFDLSVLNGIYIDFTIGVSTKNWIAGVVSTPRQSYIIPVKEGDKITITSTDSNQVQYGFLSSFSTPVEGELAPLVNGELYFLNIETTPDKERTQVIPAGSKYLYVKAVEYTQRTFPKSINIIPKEERFLYEGHYEGVSQYDTYIEENIYSRYVSNTNYAYKTYKLEEGVDYKVIVNIQPSQTYALAALDANMNQLQTFWAGTGSVDFKVMEDLPSLPSGTKYVVIVFLRGSDTYTYTGCGALMRPLKNDSFTPTNKNIYCVSKIYTPQFPYNRNEENQSFVQQEQWSAWSFMLPSSYRGNFTKKYPIVAFLHGSSAFLTSEVMSYNSANTNEGIVGNLLNKGFIVFDINGYGVSYESDQYSQHWGCPAAVDTMKKAYTIIVDRFNGRKGMVVSGISMGGAIAKSYCMTYPEDVVACALEAPSEIGCTIRTGIGQNGNFNKAWNAWDSTNNKLDMNVFLGYSPLINPQLIDENGYIIHKDIDEWNLSDWIDNSSPTKLATNMQLYGSFPVEIVIWHGDKDANVDLGYSQQFIRTIRNAGCNGKLRLCPNCEHNLNNYDWVMKEVVDFVSQKLFC